MKMTLWQMQCGIRMSVHVRYASAVPFKKRNDFYSKPICSVYFGGK